MKIQFQHDRSTFFQKNAINQECMQNTRHPGDNHSLNGISCTPTWNHRLHRRNHEDFFRKAFTWVNTLFVDLYGDHNRTVHQGLCYNLIPRSIRWLSQCAAFFRSRNFFSLCRKLIIRFLEKHLAVKSSRKARKTRIPSRLDSTSPIFVFENPSSINSLVNWVIKLINQNLNFFDNNSLQPSGILGGVKCALDIRIDMKWAIKEIV